MKVELNGAASAQLPAEPKVNKPAEIATAHTTQAPTADHTTFKGDQTVQSLVNAALRTPETREPTVNALRTAVSNGTYQVNATQTANAIATQQH